MDDDQLRRIAAGRPGYATYADTRPGNPSWWLRDVPGAERPPADLTPGSLAGPALEEAHAAATRALRPHIAEGRRLAGTELAARRAERIRQAVAETRPRPSVWRRAGRWLGVLR
ncbi:hypothetical protein AWW66_03405 [Micromonospora rosaria]|uniref:Uncharacterized protein n=1 Tax=Micromonospora rosaria TaxID=47874 RepID=A0A136PYD8_9ACTN|nr:hypothetical protein [Micromonospora rosaria]KXK63373.1 hypothetical protein AWW66_03405 [Micromonospora rosaria]